MEKLFLFKMKVNPYLFAVAALVRIGSFYILGSGITWVTFCSVLMGAAVYGRIYAGIGLALCRTIVEHHHGGRIGVELAGESCGSTSWFELPRTPSHEKSLHERIS
ncbi:hypothetical protein F6R98_15470 [Candidatus Methylospira mobilis]|uniref:Uncharacterized protein n=1 Tax=Candidatus Methylospira mobilis TaxID=1808979 RepID=A0A5Q0BJ03_9GAMM|nr:hypothetical protein [Candidatus Methylospira mobilis]QFY43855.1 hypothetical protein F6R98_15470 [Candidatus Methylospira mobilis]WNV04852.1 hypothetical protein RP726_00185 [Candidatus Methylospira mobilis]